MRRDARENLSKLTAAAAQVFAAQGLGAPLDEIARTAGVSTGTLYNRFGTREALIDAVIPELAASRMAEIAAEADAQPDPWSRFRCYVTGLLAMQAACPALDDAIARRYPDSRQVATLCDGALAHASRLLTAAQEAGTVRADAGPADLTALFLATSGILRSAGRTGDEAWKRHLGYVFDGLRAASAGK